MAKGKLTDEVRAFVVQELACFETPVAVAEAVRKEFGVEITKQSVESYDPTKRAGRNLAKKWTVLFEATRKRFIDDPSPIGIAHRSSRLRILQRMAEQAERMRNLALAAQLLEQAAKEMGEAYTNRHRLEHTGKDGGPIVTRIELVDANDDGEG